MTGKAAGVGKGPLVPQYINENPVAAFFVKTVNRCVENFAIVHGVVLVRLTEILFSATSFFVAIEWRAAQSQCERFAKEP